MANERLLEISDLIVQFDRQTLRRLPVQRQCVVEQLQRVGDHRAAAIVARMEAPQGVLDPRAVDRLLVRVHCEMQRLSEEFQHGRRVLELIQPLCQTLREAGVRPPYRLVDIGCGTGYVIRWLAAFGGQKDLELIGVDFNEALINEARALALSENLRCEFSVGNAFAMDREATIYLSTGVLHHFRGHEALADFFRQHDHAQTQAMLHFDFQPTILARPGAWLFHFVRMREPLACHDGVVSARRAHPADQILAAARQGSFACGMYSRRVGRLPVPRVFQTLIGIRPGMQMAFRASLGRRAGRLEVMR